MQAPSCLFCCGRSADAVRIVRSIFSRGLLCASAVVSAAFWLLGDAKAQTVFTRIQAFGDSYADDGNLFKIFGAPNPIVYPTGRFSGGINFVDETSTLLGIPQNNFAIGGATTGRIDVQGPGIPGFAQEWQGFIAAGRTIAPSDLVEISIGGNDARAYYLGGGSLAGVAAAATQSATQAMAGINALVGAGARNLVFTTGDVSVLPEAIGNPAASIGSAYSQSYNAQMQAGLAAVARSGVRVELVDISLIVNSIRANPALYGVANTGACPLTCIGNPALQNQYLFYFDGVHLTSLGFTILGEYIVNRLNAPLTLPAQGDVAMSSAMGFASTLFSRLDSFQAMSAISPATNSYVKASNPVPTNPWSFYMLGNGGVSDRQSSVASDGFNMDSVGGTIGAEYRINNNALVGGAFNYTNPKAQFFNNTGSTEANSYQIGGSAGWMNAHSFAQLIATLGWQDYRNTRPGIVDTITSAPNGTSFVAGGKVGYLFDVNRTQIGPIGGLTYARVTVNGYNEAGDAALTLNVGQQVAETLVGSFGAQLRFPFLIGDRMIQPYVNLTLDDDFIGNGRTIQFGATSAPLIVNNWMVPNTTSDRAYGRVATGVVAPVSNDVALTASISQTFARVGGNDFYGSGGLRISF
jgi:outer membrane lipase/esterase